MCATRPGAAFGRVSDMNIASLQKADRRHRRISEPELGSANHRWRPSRAAQHGSDAHFGSSAVEIFARNAACEVNATTRRVVSI